MCEAHHEHAPAAPAMHIVRRVTLVSRLEYSHGPVSSGHEVLDAGNLYFTAIFCHNRTSVSSVNELCQRK